MKITIHLIIKYFTMESVRSSQTDAVGIIYRQLVKTNCNKKHNLLQLPITTAKLQLRHMKIL